MTISVARVSLYTYINKYPIDVVEKSGTTLVLLIRQSKKNERMQVDKPSLSAFVF